ncbi:flavin monoamine oxidase family protein [Mycobacterium spongiae]|uniref:NAD(P)-binding protein n=1 Tax=Mycobacterium spongiae TaxID=886343 RepID=A0A975PV34_9MYCO|nr:NAD(P)/FAD-dependent oxidoreductase [Mycobacterium spongiae]QUR65741.1 NAD(P)-binding protein [Mycobacterium spongiae]
METETDRNVDRVIVVGAGAAGLAAARLLQSHGRDVVVLEGRTRVGGRMSTVDVDGALVDEGAAWIDGHKTNPIVGLAGSAGLATMRADYVDPFRVGAFDPVRRRWLGRVESLRHIVAIARATERLSEPDTTEATNLAERIDRVVDRRGRADDVRRVRRFLVRRSAELNWADRADLLGAHATESGMVYAGRESVIVGGYGRLVDVLAAGLDIRLEHVVESIRYRNEGVEVVTTKGTFSGAHAIVTVPLGVLKAGTIAFDPPLPAAKVAAIEGIGVGRLEKIIFRFDEPFWRTNPTRARNLYNIDDDTPCPIFFDLSAGAGRPTLVALLTGDHGTRLVGDPEPMIAQALAILETMFPGRVTKPTAAHTTAWQLDPLALGSYSTVRPETSEKHFADLLAPVASRLLFAGEATNVLRSGYVDGAVDSGVREASRILGHDVKLELVRAPLHENRREAYAHGHVAARRD